MVLCKRWRWGGESEVTLAAFTCALTALVGACSGVTQDGGQTGSSEVPDGPKIPPDQDGPARFGPDPSSPPTSGPIVVVTDSGVPSTLIAVSGEMLYVADTSYGVRRYELADPIEPEPVESLPLPGGASGLMVVGQSLLVLGADVAEGEGFNVNPPMTVLRRGPAGASSGEFALPETLSIPGVLRDAQVVEGDRLIVLTEVPAVGICAEAAEYPEPGMRITEIRLGDELELGDERGYPDFDGFMSKPGAILLTQGRGPYDMQLVTLDGVLQDYDRVAVTSVGLVDEREFSRVGETWTFRYLTSQRLEYGVIDLSVAEPTAATIVLPWVEDTSYYRIEAVDYDRYTLFTRTTNGANGEPPAALGPGVVVDWLAEGGPQVVFEVPAGWGRIWTAGTYLVAEVDIGLQVFRMSDSGIETVGEPFAILGDEGAVVDAIWESTREELWVTYRGLDSDGRESSVTMLGRLSLVEAPAWTGGEELVAGGARPLPYARVGDTIYSVDFPPRLWFLEASRLLTMDVVSGANTTQQVVPLEELDVAVVGDVRFSLAVNSMGELEVTAGDGSDSHTTLLTHRADQLLTVSGRVIAVGLNPTNECYPETQGQPADPACTDGGRGGITVFELESGDEPTARTTRLPTYDVDVPDGIAPPVMEWLEVAHSRSHVGLLGRRGFRCTTESQCDVLGVELGEHSGQLDETWLYPFDLDSATFGEAIQLPSRKPFDQVTTKGLVGDEQLRFMHFIGTAYNPDGVHVDSAIFELLTVDGDEQSSITLDGYPLLVDSVDYVVTVRPTVPLGSDLQGVSPASISVLELYDGAAYRVDSLDLGEGLMAYAWAQDRGVVLLRSGEDCEESTTLVSLEYEGGQVRELGRLDVLGQEWSLDGLSDEKVVLSQGKSPVQFLEVTLTSDGPEVESDVVRAWKVPVVVVGEQVFYGRY